MSGDGVDHEPVEGIEVRLRAVCGHLNVLHSQLIELAAEAIESRAWEGEGVQSILPTADVDEYVADHWP